MEDWTLEVPALFCILDFVFETILSEYYECLVRHAESQLIQLTSYSSQISKIRTTGLYMID